MLFKLCVLAAFAASIVAVPAPGSYVLHEKRDAPLKNWVKRSVINRKTKLPMRIGMKQSNLDIGDGLLMDVSRHDSPNFGKYYTPEQIIDLFAPSEESVNTIREWLEVSGIESHRITQSKNKQWMQFDAHPEEAEKLLKTDYYVYEHVSTGKTHVGCDQYHLPSHIRKHVDYITPGIKLMAGGKASSGRTLSKRDAIEERGFRTSSSQNFSSPRVKGPAPLGIINSAAAETNLSYCDSTVTPQCIAAMYNITNGTTAAAGNELGIFEEGDYLSLTDLAEFFQLLYPSIPDTTQPKVEGVDGGTIPGPFAGLESALDFEISYPIIYPQNSILFQTDDIFYAEEVEQTQGFLNTFLDAIDGSYCTSCAYGECGDSSIDPTYPNPIIGGYQGQLQCGVYKPTNVITISYGLQEDDIPTNYQQRQCAEMMKLGMQGTSIVIASGDSGVAARFDDDGNEDGCLGNGTVFNPDFPASCPYVTALGATYLPPNASAYADEEQATTSFPSGGGFSNIYSTPSYQASAVAGFFAFEDTNTSYPYYTTSGTNNPGPNITGDGIYNRGGRGYPDFAAIGDNVVIIADGEPLLIGGTSAAAPTFAAILTRINEARIAAGKSTVGFVNPTLYANPQVLHDITNGSNPGCNTSGFYVTKGWDPVTGLGTPNFPAMLDLYMGLP